MHPKSHFVFQTIMAIFKQIHYNGDLAFQQAKLVLNPNTDTFIVEIKLAFGRPFS